MPHFIVPHPAPKGKCNFHGILHFRQSVFRRPCAARRRSASKYDRLPKKGPKLHEMHGGATYEECLVPFIVFRQGAIFVPKAQQVRDTGSEYVENSDFDL